MKSEAGGGELRTLDKKLQNDGDRIQWDIEQYAELNHQVVELTTTAADGVTRSPWITQQVMGDFMNWGDSGIRLRAAVVATAVVVALLWIYLDALVICEDQGGDNESRHPPPKCRAA